MKKLGFILGSLILLIWLVNSGDDNTQAKDKQSVPSPFVFKARTGPTMSYQTVQMDTLKKGGRVNPPLEPQYTLLMARALVQDQTVYEETIVRNTLRKIVAELVERHQPDGITVRLFHNTPNLQAGSDWIAEADWWPRGHSFNPSNEYIKAKEWHEFTVKLNFPSQVPLEQIAGRVAIDTRKLLFTKIYQSEVQASHEANKRYPMETSEQASENMDANLEEADRLTQKFRNEIMGKYNVSEDELDKIAHEGVEKNWTTTE